MGKDDYTQLPQREEPVEASPPAPTQQQRRAPWKVVVPAGILFLLLTNLTASALTGKGLFGCGSDKPFHGRMNGTRFGHGQSHGHAVAHHASSLKEASCPAQPKALSVGADWDITNDEEYARKAAERLSRSVQINTVSFDDMPADPADPRFDGHTEFAKFLEAEFPSVYSSMKHEIVNTHAHLFTWEGSTDRKPVYLMAHEDTVPVNPDTVDQWTFGPWSGEITKDYSKETPGTWVWGRGASDCKNSLMGILGSVEKLLAEDFKPERTILIGYGFDEEIGGGRGALPIAEIIEERYGKDGVAFIVDEGFSGISDQYGSRIAALGMAEKGSLSVKLTVDTPGGHSSMPPPHTGIGLMSRLIVAIEDHPFEASMSAESPFLQYLTCLADYAPKFPKELKKKVRNPKKWKKLAQDLAKQDPISKAFVGTSTAVDLISGGVKVNALPEVVEATVNHRIAFTSSVEDTKKHYRDVLVPVAEKLGFSVSVFGEEEKGSKRKPQHLSIDVVGNEHHNGLEPAPITPADTEAFALIGGTIKTVFGKHTVIAPTGMFANTDTARTWNLTRNIYRFTPSDLAEAFGIHTVDERISLHGHLTTTHFYYKLIRNTEGWEDSQ